MTGRIRKSATAEVSARKPETTLVATSFATHGASRLFLLIVAAVLALTLAAPVAARAQAPVCPCTLFDDANAPFGDAAWDSPAEVGIKFRSDANGFITALRFYRQPGNVGPREGHLWTASGELLATVTFPATATSGWQTEPLGVAAAVTANTVYVASYYASTGRFGFNLGAFNGSGIDRPPLHALAATEGGNGVYRYGATSGFPTDTWNGTNYWVDLVFHPSVPADTRPPLVSSTTPDAGATGQSPTTTVKATFDEDMDPLTVTAGSFTLTDGANPVPASVAYNETTRVATLTPTAALSLGKTYTARIKAGVAGPADVAGNRFATEKAWDFSTADQCPCTLFDAAEHPDPTAVQDQPLELGVKLRTTEDGFITALRFYKQANNVGTHVGHLWTSTGQLLASATYTNETAEGWQQVELQNPVAVTKDTTYVSSYYSPGGFYARTSAAFTNAISRPPLIGVAASDGGNGVYRYGASGFPTDSWNATNYWVDASFDRVIPPDLKGPSIVETIPAANAVDVVRTTTVVAEFDEPVAAASITTTTFTLKDAQGGTVAATASYDAQTQAAKLTPSAPLAFDTKYTATLKSGASGVKDVSGNPLATDKIWSFTVAGKSPAEGPGGPILLINSDSDPFGTYYAEILRGEGLNAFSNASGTITAAMLTGKTTVLLASPSVTAAEVTVLSNWVAAGGNLIALRPDKKLASLLGITDASATLANAYMKVDNGTAIGTGIDGQTLQYHGTADRYTLSGASALATLYSNASTATANPAVTLRTVGAAGGQAAAFTYDLARSVVYTRQGNPAWVDDKRDGTGGWIPGTRAVDLFYGPKIGDIQPNWVDMDKIDVPQADEQQRLLANMITEMNLDKAPLPRFWYLPRGEKAAVIMTGDDHGYGALVPYLDRMKKMSDDGCVVADWECIRGTVYAYNDTPVSDAQIQQFQADGFEIGLHLNTGCNSFTAESLDNMLSSQLAALSAQWPSMDPVESNRTHCINWSGWATQPKVERAKGIRFDTNYYYNGPAGWLTQPGLLTGSGMPQRFGDSDGTIVDVYQSMTQVSDESDIPNPTQLHTLLDNALGSKAYYGAFNVIAHADFGDHNNANTMVAEAQRRGVPVVTSKQMLDWLDGRNGSSFANISYSGGTMNFSVAPNPKARGLEAMLPARSATGPLNKLRRDGAAVSWTRRTVKGEDYIVFNALAGSYVATYATDNVAPEITALNVVADAEGRATAKWTTDEPSSSVFEYGRTTALGYQVEDTARVTDHELEVTGLAPGTTYHAKVTSVDTAGNSASYPPTPAPFTLPAGALVDTRTADFAAGTQATTYAGATLDGTDGEVVLNPVVGEEFNGTTLPAGWISNPWYTGGFNIVADGSLIADSATAGVDTMVTPPRSLEFVATFAPVNDQGVGFSNDFGDFPFAAFSTGNNGETIQMYALSGASSSSNVTTPLPSITLSRPHRFRIEWNASTVVYYVDGALVATHNIVIPGPMRPIASDFRLFGAGVQVHWLRQGGYPTAGTFTSRPLDGGPGASVWQNLTATTVLPAGTAIAYQTRTGATPVPNASWSALQNVGAGGAVVSPPGRYIQYQARLTRTTAATPVLQRVQITRVAGPDGPPVLGTVSLSPAAPKTKDVVTATPSGFSDPDGDPLTYHYKWLRNGIAIAGATSSTLNLSQVGNGDLGDKVRVEVFATDGRGAATDAAVATKTVASTAPTAGTASVRPAPPSTNDVVTADATGFADVDAEALTYRYQWRKNNVPLAGATNRTLDLSIAGNGDAGNRIDVDIIAVDAAGGTSPAARGGQNVTNGNSTPVAGTVAVTPASPKTDQTLTATPTGFRDPDGDPITYAYQWKRNGTILAGATGTTYNLAPAGAGDHDDTITVDVTAKDNKNAVSDAATGTATVANSTPTAGNAGVKPTSPASNDIVTAAVADFADADGDPLIYQYQWYRNGAALSGSTGRTLDLSLPGNGDLGDVVGVDIRALDGRGGTSPVATGSTTVAATNSAPVAAFGFEEAAGTVAVDYSGGNDGAIDGAARINNGRFGRALSFDGQDDIVTVPDGPTLRLATGMTMEAWVKPDAASNWRTVIFKEAAGIGYSLYANGVTDNASAHIGTPDLGEQIVDGGEELDPNGWTHLAATFDGHILRLFANGVQIGSKAVEGEMLHGEGPLTFGANNIWGEHFQGLIDEVRIYSRPLSAADIAQDMGRPAVPGTPVPPPSLEPAQVGQFAAPMSWPIVPVHLALMSNGKVAAWDGFEAALNSEHTWDPWTKQFDAIPSGRNLFCAGHITLSDGRLLVVGGHINAYEGTKETNLFTPTTSTWARGADMSVARWYPTATTLPDGRVFVVSGDNPVLDRPAQPLPLTIASNTLPEIYNPTNDSWQQLPAAQRWMPLYPFMFVLPNGRLFDAGPDTTTRTLNTSTGVWTTVGTSQIDGHSAVQYQPGKILKSGTWAEPEFPGGTVTNRATAIDLNVATPAWTEVAPMKYRRSYHTLTVLPDGKVLASGGQNGTDGIDETTGILATEIWDPTTNTWTTGASSKRPRLYHSSALLLPDARVLLAGGGAFGNAKNEKSGEIYSPPYLFKGPRPQVTAAPDRVNYNSAFTVDTPNAASIAKVNLVHMGTVTHNVDMDQRLVPLNFTKQADTVTITGPANANVAPPGWYMVFLVDTNGVPSHGQIVRVDVSGDVTAPTAPASLTAAARPDGAVLTWAASSDAVGVTEYRVHRGTTSGFTPSSTNRIARVKTGLTYTDTGRSAGTYYYRVQAVDAKGNKSASSPQAQAVVVGDTTAPVVTLTAPANNASLTNTVQVTANATDAVGVQNVQFQLDGLPLQDADTTAPYAISWDTRTAADGRHVMTAVARDATGNTRTSTAVNVEVHNTGAVAAYGFEEASGATATDTISTNNGTIAGATRVVDGRFGKALSFDGNGDAVTIAPSAALNLTSGMTLEAWVKPTVLGSWRSVIFKENTGSLAYALFAGTDTEVPAGAVFTNAEIRAPALGGLPLATWAHISMTWNGTTLKTYIDAAEVASQAAPAPLVTSNGQLRIGGESLRNGWFNGLIDEVRIYARPLTAAEIAADLNRAVKP